MPYDESSRFTHIMHNFTIVQASEYSLDSALDGVYWHLQ